MSSAPHIIDCPVCRCRMTIPPGYGRRTISCSNGHVIGLERPRNRHRRRWPFALAATALLVVVALAVSGWPLHLGVLQHFAG